MAFEVIMPQMGADMTEGTLLHWLKTVGDVVARGDILAEIETDKATVELEAYDSGTLLKQMASEGDVVPVGEVIALLGEPSETPGEIHTLVVPAHCPEMITFFNISGAMIYVDDLGRQAGYEDVFTKIDMCRAHYAGCGLGADFVRQFIR